MHTTGLIETRATRATIVAVLLCMSNAMAHAAPQRQLARYNHRAAPSITAEPASLTVTVGQTATFSVAATGKAPLTYQWRMNGTAISGATTSSYTTPATTASDNAAQFTVVVSNSAGSATSNTAVLTVAAEQPLSISTASLTDGTVGRAYSATLQASGGTTPYSWSLSSGSLPAGLSLSASSGLISGTPTTAGTSSFTIKVTDASSDAATVSLSITIASLPLTITTQSVPNGSTNTAYSAFLFASGADPPYTWTIYSGALPSGLTMSSSGDITGVPTSAGTFPFGIKATDSGSPAASATGSLSITVTQGTAYSVSLAWAASPSSGVAGYNVYRSTVSGNNYVMISSALVASLAYIDATVLDGTTYYYVVTAVDGSGNESGYSPEFSIAIP
jgi:Putative Ig domain/Immunoglobulin domain